MLRWHVWLAEEELLLILHSLKKLAHQEEDKLKESALLFDKLSFYMKADEPASDIHGLEIIDKRELDFWKEEASNFMVQAMNFSEQIQDLIQVIRRLEDEARGG